MSRRILSPLLVSYNLFKFNSRSWNVFFGFNMKDFPDVTLYETYLQYKLLKDEAFRVVRTFRHKYMLKHISNTSLLVKTRFMLVNFIFRTVLIAQWLSVTGGGRSGYSDVVLMIMFNIVPSLFLFTAQVTSWDDFECSML